LGLVIGYQASREYICPELKRSKWKRPKKKNSFPKGPLPFSFASFFFHSLSGTAFIF
jgi:hypothetical protein